MPANWEHEIDDVLSWTDVTGDGLRHLAALKSLEHLILRETPIADADVASLAQIRGLKHLDLDHTKVSIACLPELKKLQKLQSLYVAHTLFTEEDVEKLRQAMPNTSAPEPDGFFR